MGSDDAWEQAVSVTGVEVAKKKSVTGVDLRARGRRRAKLSLHAAAPRRGQLLRPTSRLDLYAIVKPEEGPTTSFETRCVERQDWTYHFLLRLRVCCCITYVWSSVVGRPVENCAEFWLGTTKSKSNCRGKMRRWLLHEYKLETRNFTSSLFLR